MNTESVFNNSGVIVSNPNYNPKTKKGRAQQPFFHTLDVSQDITSGAANEFAKNAENAWVMGDTHNYQRYGVTPNIIQFNKNRAIIKGTVKKDKVISKLAIKGYNVNEIKKALKEEGVFDED